MDISTQYNALPFYYELRGYYELSISCLNYLFYQCDNSIDIYFFCYIAPSGNFSGYKSFNNILLYFSSSFIFPKSLDISSSAENVFLMRSFGRIIIIIHLLNFFACFNFNLINRVYIPLSLI
jgi:hypothetical protein